MRRALVTGATCFLGEALVRRLTAEGAAVAVVVRPTSDRARLARLHPAPELHVHDGTAASMLALMEAAAPDVVFHVAGLYRREHRPDDVAPLITSNVLFGTQLADAMAARGVRALVNTGTFFQHYDSEDYRPVNLYAATKQALETVLAYYEDAAGLRCVTLRLFDVYGEGDPRPRLLAAIRRAQRTGTPLPLPDRDVTLDLVHVDDVVSAYLAAASWLERDPARVAGRAFAVSSGERRLLSEVVALVAAAGGAPVPTAPGAFPTPARTVVTPWQGPSLPEWRPRVSLAEGVRRFLAEPEPSSAR